MASTAAWSAPASAQVTPLERNGAAVIIGVLLALNFGLISWKVAGVPVRGLLTAGMLGMILLIYPERLKQAIERFAPVLWMAAGLAVLGSFVSFANGVPFDEIFKSVSEVHVQIAITVLVAVVLAEVAGMKASATIFVAVAGASVFIALMQLLDIDMAWHLRETLGKLQKEDPLELSQLVRGRPVGIAYSPIQFSNHVCLAFAVFAAAREQEYRILKGAPSADLMILAGLALMCFAAFLSGTRSPILGAALFFLVYAVRRPGSWLAFMIMLGGVALVLVGPMLLDAFQTAQPRIVRTDDNSATGRSSLVALGLLLFADNPLGYGFGFDPTQHWSKFWQDLYTMDNPSVLKDTQLHNYVLNMLNTYGIGLLLAVPLAAHLLMRSRHVIIFFIPYIVHIMFHNFGPYWNDTPFWFTVAALAAPLLSRSGTPIAEQDEGDHVDPQVDGPYLGSDDEGVRGGAYGWR
jgi:hypothetical protein